MILSAGDSEERLEEIATYRSPASMLAAPSSSGVGNGRFSRPQSTKVESSWCGGSTRLTSTFSITFFWT